MTLLQARTKVALWVVVFFVASGFATVMLLSLAAASASATTINFASLQANPPDPELAGALMLAETSYTQQGFVIASIGGRFDVWKLGNSNFPGTSSAATSLFEITAGSETQITYGQNKPFTLDSIDFAPLLSGGSGPFFILVTGILPDESSVTYQFTINNSPFRLQTVHFPSSFRNVVAVNFIQGTNSGYFQGQETAYQFNNIVVNNRYVNGANGNDSNDCLSVQNACKTIGHAISLASSGDSVIVAAATYHEGLSIGKNLTILGSGCSKTIINGSGVAHVVSISSAVVVTLSGLSISGGGSGSAAGGGIYNAGTLTLNNSCVDGNHVQGSETAGLATGGGIYNANVLTINNGELSGNTAVASPATGASGGGIYNK